MKTICILVGYYPINRGGAEYQAYLLSSALKTRFRVFFISIGQSENTVLEKEGYIIYALKLPRHLLGWLALRSKIFKILAHERPTFIYQRVGGFSTAIAADYCTRFECKLVWHIAAQTDVEPMRAVWRLNAFKLYVRKKCLEFGIRYAQIIVGQARYQDQMLYKYYGRRCDAIVPNFAPFPTRDPGRKEGTPIRIVWIANFKEIKQPIKFIELAEHFSRISSVEFLMAGRASERWTRYLAKRCAGLERFRYLGELEVEQVEEMLGMAHILVNTSMREGYPNTFIQAWMRGVPVISLHTDPDNVIKNNEIGFHSRSMENMIANLELLIRDHTLRNDMGKRSTEFARKMHSLRNRERIVDLISSCCNQMSHAKDL